MNCEEKLQDDNHRRDVLELIATLVAGMNRGVRTDCWHRQVRCHASSLGVPNLKCYYSYIDEIESFFYSAVWIDLPSDWA